MNKYIVPLNNILGRYVYLSRAKHVWTADRVVTSPFEDVDIPNITFSEYIWTDLDKWSNKTAMVCGLSGRSYTYIQIYKQSQIFGACLRKKFNINDEDTVAIMLPNIPEYPIVSLGILAAGGVITTMNSIYTSYELQRQITMSDAKVIIAYPEYVEKLREALKSLNTKIPIIALDIETKRPDKTVSYKELVENNIDLSILKDVKRTANDVAFLPYSSGTTGLPKGVELTNKNVISNCVQQNTDLRQYNYTTDTHQDIVLANLPLFHFFGFSVVLMHKLSVGLKLITLPRFLPETLLRAFEKHRINLLYLVPPTVLFLGSNPDVKPSHLEYINCVTVGAAPLPKPDIEKLKNKINHKAHVGQAYGLTETSPVATMSSAGFDDYLSVGMPLPNVELRIVDSEMRNLGPDETGELLIKGPNVMKGYKNNPEANEHVFLDKVWFRSGDIAKINDKGFVYIADRLKELIKVNAYQVPPAELESIIKEHSSVYDAAVIGVPDSKSGERPKAFVVLKDGSTVNGKDIMDYVNSKVAPYKKIKEVQFIDAIPRNHSGKILRRILAQKS